MGIVDASWKPREEYQSYEGTNYQYSKTETRSATPVFVDEGAENLTITVNTNTILIDSSETNTAIKSINGYTVVLEPILSDITIDLYLENDGWLNDPSWSNVTYTPAPAPYG